MFFLIYMHKVSPPQKGGGEKGTDMQSQCLVGRLWRRGGGAPPRCNLNRNHLQVQVAPLGSLERSLPNNQERGRRISFSQEANKERAGRRITDRHTQRGRGEKGGRRRKPTTERPRPPMPLPATATYALTAPESFPRQPPKLAQTEPRAAQAESR